MHFALRSTERDRLTGLRAVSPAGVQRAAGSRSAPDDHFAAREDSRVEVSASGRVGRAGGRPAIRARIVSPAGIESVKDETCSTPDDHFTASPHCPVTVAGRGRVGRAGGRPTIRARIVSPAGIDIVD